MVVTPAAALLLLVLSADPTVEQAPPSAPVTAPDSSLDPATRAALAAEKAAVAAQQAAEAASRVANALVAPAAPYALPSPAPAPQAPEAKPVTWSGTASLGLISLTGNSSSFTVNGTSQTERRSEHWIFGLTAGGTYGQSRVAGEGGDPQTLALNASVRARGDRRFTERYSGYLLGGADTDHVKSVEARPFGEAGLGIIWVDQVMDGFSKARVSTDIAFRYGKELRFQYYPFREDVADELVVAPKFGAKLRYALDKNVIITEDVELLPTVVGPSRVLVNSITKLTTRVVAALGVGVSFEVKHDSRPAPDKKPTDTALTFSLEAGF